MKRTRHLFQTAVVLAGLAAMPLAAQTAADPNQGTTTPQGTHDPMPGTAGSNRDYTQDRDNDFNFGWLGLLGLAGLWGLRRHSNRTTTAGDADLHRDTDIRR